MAILLNILGVLDLILRSLVVQKLGCITVKFQLNEMASDSTFFAFNQVFIQFIVEYFNLPALSYLLNHRIGHGIIRSNAVILLVCTVYFWHGYVRVNKRGKNQEK